ncbi:uncharacterized protein N7500_004689 [Penicillium coprophilum]|uniref:uncharacterized protein n=1 Tax=Penicillium coprophilum TaxID=36646 RepID=UPI002397CBB8|nr:uncharacterized protein N7500_004689 [Penicillium coprophilum]KAJ5162859.1 hypothetical protein N7500_004689 [Penicillium coprophilum]
MSSQGPSRAGSAASAHPVDDIGFPRVYSITNQIFHRHYDINWVDNQPLFYGEISLLTPNKPGLTFHTGTSTRAPTVAVSNFLESSGDYKIGIGNPDDVSAVQRENMAKELIHKPKYRLEMTAQCGYDQTQSEGRSFLRKQTRTVGVENSVLSRWTGRNYRRVDGHTEQILGVFSGAKGLGKGEKLQIRVEYGEGFNRMVLNFLFESVWEGEAAQTECIRWWWGLNRVSLFQCNVHESKRALCQSRGYR